MTASAFLGMMGTGDWTAGDERPMNWRQGMLKLFPNGDVPLTAITSKGRSEKTDDPQFHWFDKDFSPQGGVVSDVSYTGATAGSEVTLTVSSTVSGYLRTGHTVLMVDADDLSNRAYGKVVSKTSTTIVATVLAATTTAILDAVDYVDVVGNANAEGSTIPDAINYQPTKHYSYTQIFRTPLDITRTMRKTRLRTGDAYKEQKADTLLYHGVEIEMASLFSERTENTGANSKPERTMYGLFPFLEDNYPDHVVDFTDDSSLSWKIAGEDWIDEQLELLFRYGRQEKLFLCGGLALRSINQLVKSSSYHTFTPTTAAYGIKVMEWTTPFGVAHLKVHPLFNHKTYLRRAMIGLEPENLRWRYITDTKFKKSSEEDEAGHTAYDGTKEEFITEGGWEIHHPKTMMIMRNVGLDGAAS